MITFPPNFGQVAPGLMRSGSPTYMTSIERRRFADAVGLRTVVRLADEEPNVSWPSGVVATSLPSIKPVMTRVMWRRWKEFLQDKSNWPILVHCHAGAERTGVYVAHAEILLGQDLWRVMARLQKHGEGFWRRSGDIPDLAHLRQSLEHLQDKGDVLPDKAIIAYMGLGGDELDRRHAATLDAFIESDTNWTPRAPFRS